MKRGLGRILVVTGSGISAESGIPTFRGVGGYWRSLDPAKLATARAFEKDPEMIWQWYRERRKLIYGSQPNEAHNALVKLAANTRDFLLLTQNVDDLHARATWKNQSLAREKLVQIHGDIFVTRCSHCDFTRRQPDSDTGPVPRCPRCNSLLRPGVVWFDEELDTHEVERMENFLKRGPCETVLVIGTTASFNYIVDWSLAAKGTAGCLIEVNIEETPLSKFATKTIRESAAKAMPMIVNELLGPE